jgi:hypothetical protein
MQGVAKNFITSLYYQCSNTRHIVSVDEIFKFSIHEEATIHDVKTNVERTYL